MSCINCCVVYFLAPAPKDLSLTSSKAQHSSRQRWKYFASWKVCAYESIQTTENLPLQKNVLAVSHLLLLLLSPRQELLPTKFWSQYSVNWIFLTDQLHHNQFSLLMSSNTWYLIGPLAANSAKLLL